MAKGVLIHKAGSIYDDVPSEQYQFPKIYLNALVKMQGDWIAYYEPSANNGRKAFTSVAKIREIVPDPTKADHHLAVIEPGTYLEFDRAVPRLNPQGRMYESKLQGPDGPLRGGQVQSAVRLLSDADFEAILEAGFLEQSDLPRIDAPASEPRLGVFNDNGQAAYTFERRRVETLVDRPFRSRVFRRQVLSAYGSRCALTGIRLINGGGRVEAEAAHIRPVANGGPDSVRNGLALSGTVHWMFDRGLISLADDYSILISRKTNDRDTIEGLINRSGHASVPDEPALRPHPDYLKWHRENPFAH